MSYFLLPYEIIDIILKMISTKNDIYYLQVDHKTGKLIYKHNMRCLKLSNLIIKPIKYMNQHLLYNNIVYNIISIAINSKVIYKKNIDNTIFIYYRKYDNKFNGELITNKISHVMTDYDIWTSIQHTDGYCYDCVGMPRFLHL